jgi:hypothetical protein
MRECRRGGEREAATGMTLASRRSVRVLGLALSALASAAMALGCGGYFYSSRAYFANTTREQVKVRVQKLLADVDCSRVKGRSGELLGRRLLFGEATTYEVEPGEALPLDYEDEGSSWPRKEGCAALVQVLGFPDQLVFWPPDARFVQIATTRAEADRADFREQSLALEGHGEVKGLAAGSGLEVTPLPPLAAGVQAINDPPAALGWSGVPRAGADFVLLRREALPDGCMSLELGRDLSSSWPLFLCAPDWSFPFAAGDELGVSAEELAPPPSNTYPPVSTSPARHLRISSGGRDLGIWLNVSKSPIEAATLMTGQGAPGRQTGCGAYVEPASLALPAINRGLAPGEEATLAVPGGTSRVLLGRAEDVLVAREACGPEYSTLGARFDLLILHELAEKLP